MNAGVEYGQPRNPLRLGMEVMLSFLRRRASLAQRFVVADAKSPKALKYRALSVDLVPDVVDWRNRSQV